VSVALSELPRQPWRVARALPRGSRRVMLSAATQEVPAPLVVVFDDRPESSRKPPPTMRSAQRNFYRLRALVLPGHILLDPGTGRLMPIPLHVKEGGFLHPGLSKSGGGLELRRQPRRRATRIDGPVFLADTFALEYGHVLLEILPRLAHLDRCPPETKVLTSLVMREPYLTLFAHMGVPAERIVHVDRPMICKEAYVVDSPIDIRSFMTTDAWRTFERLATLGDASSIDTPERIYVSRRGASRRHMLNEEEIEALFMRYGFTILHPEQLSIQDQVRLFSRARMIAGPRGSGLHNIVFSRPDTPLLLLTERRSVPAIDTFLMRADGTLAYAMGDVDAGSASLAIHLRDFTVDPGLAERALRSHFGL
jgi:hypothetical protein